ncbi:hypothetical protein [Clostridium magnum]|nr:hypothetical protein [Clostridium magnum]SHJ29260.1 hypothetical protein SAMN02745944_05705 [Clostridium magnum DSM 2767]
MEMDSMAKHTYCSLCSKEISKCECVKKQPVETKVNKVSETK